MTMSTWIVKTEIQEVNGSAKMVGVVRKTLIFSTSRNES